MFRIEQGRASVRRGRDTNSSCGFEFSPTGIAAGTNGVVYLNSSCGAFAVSGMTTTRLPGSGSCENYGNRFMGIAADGRDNVYFVTAGDQCSIKKYDGHETSVVVEDRNCPAGIAVNDDGVVYATLGNCTVVRIEGGQSVRVAGNGECSIDEQPDGPALSLSLSRPQGLALARNGDLYISEGFKIRRLSRGAITTVAGSGEVGYSGDGGPAPSAAIDGGFGVAIDEENRVYFVEFLNCVVRRISNGKIDTIAGTACNRN